MSNQETGLVALRGTRLLGNATFDTDAWAVTDPIKLDLSFEYDNGADLVQRAGDGRICFTRRRSDELKSAGVKFELCGGAAQLMELFLNGPASVITETAVITGFGLEAGSCTATTRPGIYLEWWTEGWACNALATVQYVRHVLPKVIVNYDGGSWDENRHTFAFTGVANSNKIQGGPDGDITGFDAGTAYLYVWHSKAATEATIPAASTDYEDVPIV